MRGMVKRKGSELTCPIKVVIITTSRVVIGEYFCVLTPLTRSIGDGQANGTSDCRLIDSDISTPCSIWDQYKKSRTSWGINVLGSFLVEIEASDGTVGFATGFGGMDTRLKPT